METFANDIEFRPAEEIKAFQEQLLQKALHYLAGHSAYYRRMFERCEIRIDQIRHIEDLVKIPFTEKKDLQLFNEEFLCCPREKVIDYVTTSGTLGDPVTFGCTELDLQRLAYNEKKSFACAGLRPGNIVQLMTTLDKRFMAGLAYFLGIRELGASVIRVGNGIPELQWDTIRRLKPDTIMCVPSFILRLIQYAEEHDIDYRRSSIRRIIGIGEGLREQDFSLNLLGQRIREKWDVQLFATYSSTEMGATFSECEYGCGGHIHPELIIVEIIGPDNLPVADGEYGEIVVTTLGVEGMPLLRYRTKDLTALHYDKCPCGRTLVRMDRILGRSDDMLIIRGVNVFPTQIESVILEMPEFEPHYLLLVDRKNNTDTMELQVEVRPEYYSDEINKMLALKKKLTARLQSVLGLGVDVRLVEPRSIERSVGKAKRVIDNRKL